MKEIIQRLKSSIHISAPELEARWILESSKNVESAIARRLDGEPLAYILGEKEFYSLTFAVNPNVLIPRPESEHIVDEALSWAKSTELKNARVLDLGAGSGCIGLSVIRNLEKAQLCTVDCSAEALEVVKLNAKNLNLLDQIKLVHKSVEELNETDGRADIILANPPYIDKLDLDIEENVKKYEPAVALFADEKGYGSIRRWSEQLEPLMAPKCLVLFEIGSSQGMQSKETFEALEIFDKIEILKDYSGHDRVIRAERF